MSSVPSTHPGRLVVLTSAAVLCFFLPLSLLARPAMPPRTRILLHEAKGCPSQPANAPATFLVEGASRETLQRAGATPLVRIGPFFVVQGSSSSATRLSERDDVVRLDLGHALRPLLDMSAPLVHAPEVHEVFAVTGSGVIVGIVDTGIDLTHADFRFPDGRTRIRYLLDLSAPPAGYVPDLEQMYGGAVYPAEVIDGWLTSATEPPTKDTYGHGTHVAGIAGGNGRGARPGATPGRYVGIAPEAELVIVKATRDAPNLFSDADVVLGVHFVFQVASRLGRPAVVNLSLGGQAGPHDGSTSLERALASMLDGDPEGRAIVVASGNEGGLDIHASGSLPYGSCDTVLIDLTDQARPEEKEHLYFEVWYRSGFSLVFTLESPSGHRYGPVGPGRQLDKEGDAGRVTIAVDGVEGHGVWAGTGIMLRPAGNRFPERGTWRLTLCGTASRWDLWIAEDTLGGRGAAVLSSHVDPDMRLAIPAMAEPLIAVGAFVSRDRWINVDGETIQRVSPPGRISWFSAPGPTLDGRLKPDVVAPGEFVISALSADAYPTRPDSAFYVPGEPRYLWADDGVHGALRGTSQAAPHVAGVVALLLEAEPRLRPSELREAIRLSATTDDFTGRGHAYAPRFGFGKLHALTALRLVQGEKPGPVSPVFSTLGVTYDILPPQGGASVTVIVVPKDETGLPLGPGHDVVIHTDAGALEGTVTDVGTGRYEQRLLPGHRGERATLRATVDGVPLAAEAHVWFVDQRDEIGAELSSTGGGCAVSAHKGPLSSWVILLLLAVAGLRRRNYVSFSRKAK